MTTSSKVSRTYLVSMAAYWFVFGLITTFYPKLMDLFQTEEGINAKSVFSDHVWFHGGLDIIALCIVLLALSREAVSKNMLKAAALAALMPTIAIGYSLVSTLYWNPMFIVAGVGCLAFVIWGLMLAGKQAE